MATSKQLAELEKEQYQIGNTVFQNADTNYEPKITPILIGMPATYYVGSDSYAVVVTGVNYFKSGDRAGLIKSVEINRFGKTETFRPRFYSSGITWKGEYSSLGLGYAKEYLDPHF